jgi:hypothetical protein
MHTITIGGGKTVKFETEEQVLLFLACVLTFDQFSMIYRKTTGKKPPLRLYRENSTSESRVRFLRLAAETPVSDGTLLIDNLPSAREAYRKML